jgi:hypothetical protein
MGQFSDIRPYNDSEVSAVINSLLSDNEFITAIASLKLGAWYKPLAFIVRPVVRRVLRKQLRGVNTVHDFQAIVKGYMNRMVDTCTAGFSVSGIEVLEQGKPYLFISNHRDIALDPAFVNYSLYHNGHDTVRIAIGDNLLTKSYVSDLMRINKSFIVKRSAKGPRQILAAYKLLSNYIRHSIEEDNSPIWIAQREGRAKNGIDRTEPAIIKMIAMSQDKKTESFAEFINKLHIVPVAISYELDPCDGAKAQELYEKAESGNYQKAEHEDVENIAKGITGEKGRVHVAFGTPLNAEFLGADEVAAEIDRQIIDNYVLQPTNFFAYEMLHGSYPQGVYSDKNIPFAIDGLEAQRQAFADRIEALPAAHRAYALGIYANIIDRKQQFKEALA